MEDSFENTADSLVPILQPESWRAEMAAYGIPLPIHQPWIPGLYITYILDFPEYQVSLSPDVVQQFMGQFNPPIERVHQVALHNLRQRTSADDYAIEGQGKNIKITCKTQDKLTASRVLLHDLMETWSGIISGPMLLGIPHRDCLIAIGQEDETNVDNFLLQIEQEYQGSSFPLWDKGLIWDQGEIKL